MYRDAYLVGLDEGTFVTNTYIHIYKDGSRPNVIANETLPWVVNVSVDYLAANTQMSLELGVEIAGCNARSQTKPLHPGINTIQVILNISEGAVERWWPAEFGRARAIHLVKIAKSWQATQHCMTQTFLSPSSQQRIQHPAFLSSHSPRKQTSGQLF